jgi:acyl-CoA reductase-like NAD-dependent aldehyde dehydrogenase
LKTRNALVYSCHHNALQVGNRTGELIQTVLSRRGAPVDLVQWVRERAGRRKTMMLMKHKGIAFILATGGPSLVKAAYSSGTPAIGVGAGNAPVLICADADPVSAAQKVVAGKSFDNGVICGSENNLVVEAAIRAAFVEGLRACGAAVLTPDEKNRLVAQIVDEQGRLDRAVIGKSARFIASRAGISRGYEIRLLVIPAGLDEVDGPLGREKLAPVISLFTVSDAAQGLETCQHILANEGRGHTAVIHTCNQEWIDRFGREIEASRILVNTSAALGCIGVGSGLLPSMTLGCGTFGGNSTTDNVTYRHLINIKRLAMSL